MREDDMDEMMRKAAENYEVDADKAADWNFVYKAVHEAEDTMPAGRKTKRRFLFWWLLLIPLGWLAHTGYNNFYAGRAQEQTNPASPATTGSTENGTAVDPLTGKITGDEVARVHLSGTDKNNSIKQPPAINRSIIQRQTDKINKDMVVYKDNGTSGQVFDALQNMVPVGKATKIQDGGTQLPDLPGVVMEEEGNAIAPGPLSTTVKKDSAFSHKQDSVTTAFSGEAKNSVIKIKTSKNYFYAGLVAGADLSFVKYQELRPPGYNIGLLAGYRFKKLSIESGLLFVRKNYYTDGGYFDKSEIPYFSNARILTVDGYCRMFEIPLNARYNFIEKKRHAFFATGGLSSYLMNKEFYNYDYIRNGEQHSGSKAYYHSTQNWFSVFNLSAGYELQTGAKSSLRIEPYFKAPLSGMGTGSLSISSAGINVGITRRVP